MESIIKMGMFLFSLNNRYIPKSAALNKLLKYKTGLYRIESTLWIT